MTVAVLEDQLSKIACRCEVASYPKGSRGVYDDLVNLCKSSRYDVVALKNKVKSLELNSEDISFLILAILCKEHFHAYTPSLQIKLPSAYCSDDGYPLETVVWYVQIRADLPLIYGDRPETAINNAIVYALARANLSMAAFKIFGVDFRQALKKNAKNWAK